MIDTAKPQDAHEMQLRPEDAAEVTEGWRERVEYAIQHHPSLSLRDEQGNLVALGGVVDSESAFVPWLLCSPLLVHHKASVWRAAKRAVSYMQHADKLVGNFIPKDSHGNRRFVRALGFQIVASPMEGPDFFYFPHV